MIEAFRADHGVRHLRFVGAASTGAAKLARLAHSRFGKGVVEPGVLNFGDCLASGVAMAEREPLLFKGSDFAATDVTRMTY